mmetsp:Transcript_10194/g.13826  ORF Transcript_10194/g.13826 Transcript_10194/m.13826 type:complete len:106 (+) Transcript_10194:2-319(+)
MKSMSFAVAVLASAALAESDFNLERAVQKNLKWIRPPKFDESFHDIDSFFSERPGAEPTQHEPKPFARPHMPSFHRDDLPFHQPDHRERELKRLQRYHEMHDNQR